MSYPQFEDLKNKIIYKIYQINDQGQDELHIITTDGKNLVMYHEQDCCESVWIDDIIGNISDVLLTPVLDVYETTEHDEVTYESSTFTFYRIRTIKGEITIRWVGESNGYYSESVDLRYEDYKLPVVILEEDLFEI